MIRIALVDDHNLFRKSMMGMIKNFQTMEVVIEKDNVKDFLELIAEVPVDVLLLDVQMPVINGFEACKIISKSHPAIKILIVSQFSSKECLYKLIEYGAHGFYSKSFDLEKLENAINTIYDNEPYFDVEICKSLNENDLGLNKHFTHKLENIISLTPREIKIIELASKELNSPQIAAILCISIRTVETHRKKIMEKTGSKNFTGSILFAVKNGFLFL